MDRLRSRAGELAEQFAAAVGHEALARLGGELAEVDDALRSVEERWLEVATEAESGG